MSHSIVTPALEFLVVAGRAVALVSALTLFAWGFMRWRRAAQRDTQRIFEQLDLLRADLHMMQEVMRGAAQRVDSAAQRVVHDTRAAPVQTSSAGRSYEIAARLAKNGARKEDLIKNCGITAHEAELLVRLHGGAQHASTQPTARPAAVNAQAPSTKPQVSKQPTRSRLVAVG